MKNFRNPFEISGKWYKANLHAHTTVSDGKTTPSEQVNQYRQAGYDVLALTDHYKTNDISGFGGKRFLVVSGMEYHPPCPTSSNIHHLVALNVPHGFDFGPKEKDHANRCIAKVNRAGGLTILAHPYWCGHSFEDFKYLKGLAAIEVCNSICARIGRSCSENEWSYAMDHGMVLPGVGSDDVHFNDEHDMFGSWTWLKMPSLTARGVVEAIRTGACYASTGPVIHYFGIKDGKLRLRCSPAGRIEFICNPPAGASRIAKEGKTISAFSAEIPKNWNYVRARVTDPTGKMAWTNPIELHNDERQ